MHVHCHKTICSITVTSSIYVLMYVYSIQCYVIGLCVPVMFLHLTSAGTGLHTPALVQVAVITPSGDNPGLHWKVITDPSVVSILL